MQNCCKYWGASPKKRGAPMLCGFLLHISGRDARQNLRRCVAREARSSVARYASGEHGERTTLGARRARRDTNGMGTGDKSPGSKEQPPPTGAEPSGRWGREGSIIKKKEELFGPSFISGLMFRRNRAPQKNVEDAILYTRPRVVRLLRVPGLKQEYVP